MSVLVSTADKVQSSVINSLKMRLLWRQLKWFIASSNSRTASFRCGAGIYSATIVILIDHKTYGVD